jgi:hypothetical protein
MLATTCKNSGIPLFCRIVQWSYPCAVDLDGDGSLQRTDGHDQLIALPTAMITSTPARDPLLILTPLAQLQKRVRRHAEARFDDTLDASDLFFIKPESINLG